MNGDGVAERENKEWSGVDKPYLIFARPSLKTFLVSLRMKVVSNFYYLDLSHYLANPFRI